MHIIIGGGQVGTALAKVLQIETIIDKAKPDTMKLKPKHVEFMHVCFPYTELFIHDVVKHVLKLQPKVIVIHSTVAPGTSETLAEFTEIPVIYSPVRGIHSHFTEDIKYYTKFWAVAGRCDDDILERFVVLFDKQRIKTKSWARTIDLEFAKIATDTTYYAWMVAYRYAIDMAAQQSDVDPEKIWEFAKEIHDKLHNRPKMYSDPNGIGGHCLLPNLQLIPGNTAFADIASIITSINNKQKGEEESQE